MEKLISHIKSRYSCPLLEEVEKILKIFTRLHCTLLEWDRISKSIKPSGPLCRFSFYSLALVIPLLVTLGSLHVLWEWHTGLIHLSLWHLIILVFAAVATFLVEVTALATTSKTKSTVKYLNWALPVYHKLHEGNIFHQKMKHT